MIQETSESKVNYVNGFLCQGNFAAMFVLNYQLREFLLSAFANRFGWRCELKQMMLLYYKVCPCYGGDFWPKLAECLTNMQLLRASV